MAPNTVRRAEAQVMESTALEGSVVVSEETRRTLSRAGSRFSQFVWELDWSEILPQVLTDDGIAVEYSTVERAFSFIGKNFAIMFEENSEHSPFLPQKVSEPRIRYYEQVADIFEFKQKDKSVGFLICTPGDWSTYYIRFVAILPEYRGRGLFQRFLPHLFEILRGVGMERVEAETSPANLAFVHLMTKFAFNVTGTTLTERWGALVRFTKFLDARSEEVFLHQYCTGIKYQLRGGTSRSRLRERRTP
jgi:ribosomal protein S18 acetylase RimI-like enzyme